MTGSRGGVRLAVAARLGGGLRSSAPTPRRLRADLAVATNSTACPQHQPRAFTGGFVSGTLYSAIDTGDALRGRAPWTLRYGHRRITTGSSSRRMPARPSTIPRPDGEITFDQAASSVYLSSGRTTRRTSPSTSPSSDASEAGRRSISPSTMPPNNASVRPGSTRSSKMTTAGKAADQRAELRTLQDLRHQGPDPEHRVGGAGGRGRPELPEHVGGGPAGGPAGTPPRSPRRPGSGRRQRRGDRPGKARPANRRRNPTCRHTVRRCATCSSC